MCGPLDPRVAVLVWLWWELMVGVTVVYMCARDPCVAVMGRWELLYCVAPGTLVLQSSDTVMCVLMHVRQSWDDGSYWVAPECGVCMS